MHTDARHALFDLAAAQHGLFRTSDATHLGLTTSALHRWRRAGLVRRVEHGVWAVNGSPITDEQRALVVVLHHGHGAAVSRGTAAWLWRVPGHLLGEVHVVRRRDLHVASSGRSHSSRCIDAVDLTIRRGVPVTTPVRTIFDLAAAQHPQRTRRDLNHLMARGLVRLHQLDEALGRLARRGRPGISVMRELIAEVHEKGEPAGSSLELVVEDLLDVAGFRRMERQVPLYDDAGFVGRVDFGDRRRRIAIEVDSDRFHGGLVDREGDSRRDRRLVALGWEVIRVTEQEVWWERDALVTRLRRALWASTPQPSQPSPPPVRVAAGAA